MYFAHCINNFLTLDAVQLKNGNFPNEGRATAFNGKKWGTICDKEPKPGSWASTLCHELGYNHAIDAIQVVNYLNNTYFMLSEFPRKDHFIRY